MPHASEDLGDKLLHPRDRLFRDTFTPAETLSFWTLLITSAVAFTLADPRSFWVLGFFLIAGGFSPVILKTHEQTHPFFVDKLWRRFWFLSAPVWLICIQYIVGLFHTPLVPVELDGQSFEAINKSQPWLPATSASSTTWITLLGYGSAYIVALDLFVVPKSRSFFERILPLFCLFAVLIAVFGYLQKAAGFASPFLTKGTGQSDFFAFFPYEGHWAAFAMLWSAVCVALALYGTRMIDNDEFIQTTGPWYLTGATLLGGSGFLIDAQWPSAILLLTFSVLLLVVAVNFLASTKDKHHMPIAFICGLISTGTFATGIYRIFQNNELTTQARSLHHAAYVMFTDRPVFGWGLDSFAQLAPFYTDDYLQTAQHARASSDVLQYLAELGFFGFALFPIICAYLVFRHYRRRRSVILTNHLLIGCAGVAALAFCDTPFMSPTVFLSFFVILFSALRWADLSRLDVDEVDANERPQLVVPESERRVPLFKGTHKEQAK